MCKKNRNFIFKGLKNNSPINIYIYITINKTKILLPDNTANIIHIKLLILEKPKNFMTLIVSILLAQTTNLFSINRIRIRLYFISKELIMTKGMNFCSVDNKNILYRLVIF